MHYFNTILTFGERDYNQCLIHIMCIRLKAMHAIIVIVGGADSVLCSRVLAQTLIPIVADLSSSAPLELYL